MFIGCAVCVVFYVGVNYFLQALFWISGDLLMRKSYFRRESSDYFDCKKQR